MSFGAYILSNLGFICLFIEHISVYTFHPLHASNMLGGGTVGAQYSENHKPYPMLGSLHHQALAKPQTIRILGKLHIFWVRLLA